MDKTRLVEKPYRDKTKKDKKEITLITKNIKNKIINLKKLKRNMKILTIEYKKQKRQQNYKKTI